MESLRTRCKQEPKKFWRDRQGNISSYTLYTTKKNSERVFYRTFIAAISPHSENVKETRNVLKLSLFCLKQNNAACLSGFKNVLTA